MVALPYIITIAAVWTGHTEKEDIGNEHFFCAPDPYKLLIVCVGGTKFPLVKRKIYLRVVQQKPVRGLFPDICLAYQWELCWACCSTPQGLEDVSKYPQLLAALLEDPSWREEDLKKLAGLNLLRVFRAVEEVRSGSLFTLLNDWLTDSLIEGPST